MSAPSRQPLSERSGSDSNRLRIRIVPYSPPRLCSDLSTAPHSARDFCSQSPSGSTRENVEIYRDRTISPTPVQEQSSPLSPLTPAQLAGSRDGERRRSESTPRRPSTSSSVRRPRHVINVHADKTFSLQPHSVTDSSNSVYSSSFLTSTISSYGRGSSSAAISTRRQSSLLAAHNEDSAPTSPESYVSPSTPHTKNLVNSSSPWNYEFVGGVRKVQETPQSRLELDLSPSASSSPAYSSPTTAGHVQLRQETPALKEKEVAQESSFRTDTAGSGSSGLSNLQVLEPCSPNFVIRGQTPREHGRQAPVELGNFTPISNSNYRILGDSASSDYSLSRSRPGTEEDERNFVRLGRTQSPSLPSGTPKNRLRTEFSRESLVIPPLNPVRKLFPDRPTSSRVHKSITPPRFIVAWSSMVRQDAARALFSSRIHPPRRRGTRPSSRDTQRSDYGSTPRSSHPHQMQSPPLSTVFSESEESEHLSQTFSRLSPESEVEADGAYVLDNTPGPSTMPYSRQFAPSEESVEWPQPAYIKGKEREGSSLNPRIIGDQDEHGDGLTDLTDLRDLVHRRPSRRGGFPTVLASYSSDRNLRSSASARAYGLNMASIPAWARVYYGSGEHRYLLHQASRDSIRSDYSESQGGSSMLGRTPSLERFPFAPSRKRRRNSRPETEDGPSVLPKISYPDLGWAMTIRKQTSSLWSPHLRRDKRASKYYIWEPPAGILSFEGNMATKRNAQVFLFIAGFIFPFAWIVAAFLPLPPHHDLTEKDFGSTSHIDLTEEGPSPAQLAKENGVHSRANWWRDLNRVMAVVGLLVMGAFAVLIAIGVRQQ